MPFTTPFIQDVRPELGSAGFNPATDVKELFEIGGTQPGGGDTFSIDAAEAVLVYVIDWRKARAFIRWALGFDYADKGPPYRIHRENPQRHPRWPKLYAKTVHFSSISPKANDEGTGRPQPNSPNYPAVFLDTLGIGKQGYYDSCYCTVRYDRPNYDVLEDHLLGDISQPLTHPASELWRNCVADSQSSVELLTAEGGQAQFVWKETRVAPPGGQPGPDITEGNNVVANTFAIRVSRTKILLKLHRWPESYLSENSFIPFYKNIVECAGKVNSTTFLGFPAGTVRLDAPTSERFQYPVSTFDGYGAFFGVNLAIPLTYFNPSALGAPDTDYTDDNKARGYRVYLHSASRKWYGIQGSDGSDPAVKWPIEEADLNKIFRHVLAP